MVAQVGSGREATFLGTVNSVGWAEDDGNRIAKRSDGIVLQIEFEVIQRYEVVRLVS